MAHLHTPESILPHIPNNLTLARFMLDYSHESRPARGDYPCMVDDISGCPISLESLRFRVDHLAHALHLEYQIGDGDTVMLIGPNHIDYPVAIWAVHKLGGILTCTNPLSTLDELSYQISLAKVSFIVAHSSVLGRVMEAAKVMGLSPNRVILFDDSPSSFPNQSSRLRRSVPELVFLGEHKASKGWPFHERRLSPGEGATKVAMLCWSSGTTGKPKAVAITHMALIANIIQMAAHNQVDGAKGSRDSRSYRPGDVALGVLPFFHVAGLVIGLHLVLFCGMTLVVPAKYDFSCMLDSISRHQISHLILVPPQAISFTKHPHVFDHDFVHVKYVLIGAAPVPRDVQDRLQDIFPSAQIGQAYGMTEMTTTVAMVSPKQRRGPLGSGGRLLPGIEARVIRSDGSPARLGEKGELIVRGPALALGYLDNPRATSQTFVDGWVHTGDQVILTSDREVFIFDRLKEILKVKGHQVAPAELEGCLLTHPDIVDSCVVGIPDEYCGEVPLAYVVLTESATKCMRRHPDTSDFYRRSIVQHVADRTTRYKHLRGGVRFISSIPAIRLQKNGNGKILRRILREEARLNPPSVTNIYAQPKL